MSADARYKLSTLLDLLHKQFGLQPEFHVNAWHVLDPSAHWRLIACGKCGKEASDANLKLGALENALKQAGVKWRYDNDGATCNVKLFNNQYGLGEVMQQGQGTFHGFTVPEGVGFYKHERGGSITISEHSLIAMLRQAQMDTSAVVGRKCKWRFMPDTCYSREVYTRDAEGNVTFKRDPDKDVPDWVLAFDNKVTPAPHGWKLNDWYLADHGNNLRAFLDVGWDIESLKANKVLVPDAVTYSVTIIEGEANEPKVTQINSMPVPDGVKINYNPSTRRVELTLGDLQRLISDATLRASPAKVD